MNKEVNFEIAKLLKEKGFPQPKTIEESKKLGLLYNWYNEDGKYNACYKLSTTIQAPTIAEVKMWLYDNYGIWVYVQKDWHTGECLGFEGIIDFIEGLIGTKTVNSPTEAYELAIKYTLENLIYVGNNEQQ